MLAFFIFFAIRFVINFYASMMLPNSTSIDFSFKSVFFAR